MNRETSQYREDPDGEANQKAARENTVAVAMVSRKQFCLSCGETYYEESCPYCDPDTEEDL